jgi:hypothetical protein
MVIDGWINAWVRENSMKYLLNSSIFRNDLSDVLVSLKYRYNLSRTLQREPTLD